MTTHARTPKLLSALRCRCLGPGRYGLLLAPAMVSSSHPARAPTPAPFPRANSAETSSDTSQTCPRPSVCCRSSFSQASVSFDCRLLTRLASLLVTGSPRSKCRDCPGCRRQSQPDRPKAPSPRDPAGRSSMQSPWVAFHWQMLDSAVIGGRRDLTSQPCALPSPRPSSGRSLVGNAGCSANRYQIGY